MTVTSTDPAWCPGPGGRNTPRGADVRSAGTPGAAGPHLTLTGGPRGSEPLGPMVRRLRLDADLTLEGLSEASGISDRALSDIERGAARGPQHRTVLAIAAALGLTDLDRTTMIRAAREGRRRATRSSLDRLALPPDAADFTGREVELARITAWMTRCPDHRPAPIVVTGPAGYGKTSLAVRAAALVRSTFPDQLFLRLGGVAPETPSPDVVLSRIVHALTGGRERTSGDTGLLRRLLGERPLLLVLDDAANESQVRAVLSVAESAAVLVTSRRSLAGLDGVERVFLDQLCSEEAQQLLAAVIPAERTAGADLAGLARLCDGVPLALRIAGNRLASRPGSTVAALAARMAVEDRRLDALTAGDLGMAAAIRPSFDRLSPEAQELFRRLALVDGSTFGAGLAGALIGQPAWHAEDLLDELADLSLVQPVAGDRYAFHDLLRLYAKAELAHEPAPGRAAIRAAADDWLVATAVGAARMLRSGDRTATSIVPAHIATSRGRELARAWLIDEADNWGAAVERVIRRDQGRGTPGLAVPRHDAPVASPRARHRGQAAGEARPMADSRPAHVQVAQALAAAARTVPCAAASGS